MKLYVYHDQRNAQVFYLFINFTSALHVSGFLFEHRQRQVYNFGMVKDKKTWTNAEIVQSTASEDRLK
jgi:hypothetical protein